MRWTIATSRTGPERDEKQYGQADTFWNAWRHLSRHGRVDCLFCWPVGATQVLGRHKGVDGTHTVGYHVHEAVFDNGTAQGKHSA